MTRSVPYRCDRRNSGGNQHLTAYFQCREQGMAVFGGERQEAWRYLVVALYHVHTQVVQQEQSHATRTRIYIYIYVRLSAHREVNTTSQTGHTPIQLVPAPPKTLQHIVLSFHALDCCMLRMKSISYAQKKNRQQ